MSDDLDKKLRDMPVRRWQCLDGCRYLRGVVVDGQDRARCGFWETIPKTLTANPTPSSWLLSPKHTNGPFTDEPTKECAHFEVRRTERNQTANHRPDC